MKKTASVAVGNRRLLKLAAFLRTLPRQRFNYAHWVGDDWEGAPSLSCGTTACALGWATTIPAFRKLGLHLSRYGTPTLSLGGRPNPFEVARRLFGLNGEEYGLFIHDVGEENATPKYVARKIERFVAARGNPR